MTEVTAALVEAEARLHSVFGFKRFRPGQADVLGVVLANQDAMVIMPTGGGKSLCYQLPALVRDGLTVVISPLIALMRDQVSQLQAFGVAAAALNSQNSPEQNAEITAQIRRGEIKLLYVAPERLVRGDMKALLRESNVNMIAVDEAHCVSQWGHDFRPEYLEIGRLREELPGVQIIALTATADETTRGDIADKLFAEPPKTFVFGFDRPNLSLAMAPKANAKKQMLNFIEAHRGDSGIVYCLSRKGTENLAAFLSQNGHRALAYHAGLENGTRAAAQDAFLKEDGVVICATIAFGMGIDKPDVRFVGHADLPKNIESYYQEIGRAGRDGLPADTLMLFGMADVALRGRQIAEGDASDEQKRVENQKLNALVALCVAPRCRRQTLLAYFAETIEPCGNCDLCSGGVELEDGTVPAQKALSAVVRTGQRFGTEHLVSILTGKPTEAIRKWRHDDLPRFGIGTEFDVKGWRTVYRQLYAAGHLSLDPQVQGRWLLTDSGTQVLKGQLPFQMRKDLAAPAKVRKDRPARVVVEGADPDLLEALKAKRRELAQKLNVPAYVVFPDRTLAELSASKPRTLDEMGTIHGIGIKKLEKFGETFLAVVNAD